MNRKYGVAHRWHREAVREWKLPTRAGLAEVQRGRVAAPSVGNLAAGSILVQTSDSRTSLIVTKTEDLSNIAPGKDRIAHGIEDVTLDIFASDLLANDTPKEAPLGGRVGGASGAELMQIGVSDCRHGRRGLERSRRNLDTESMVATFVSANDRVWRVAA